MANTLVQFRIDERQRKQAEGICEQLGLDLSSYLRMSVTRLIREKKVPFGLCVAEDDKYAAALLDAISKLQASAKADGFVRDVHGGNRRGDCRGACGAA